MSTRPAGPPPQWVELAGRITALLPHLAAEQAERIVAELTPAARGRARAHFAKHPDALVSGASDAPRSVQALITTLTDLGVEGVRKPACPRCGRVRLLRRPVPGGRVCLGCEGSLAIRGNTGPCAECGEVRPRPSHQTCARCRRLQVAASRSCSACGKPAPMDPCTSCRPRPPAPCALCGTNAPVDARWPLGPVCKPCYREARRRPAACPACEKQRVLIARHDGVGVCGPCAGHGDPYACPRCTSPRSYMVRGLCDRCTLHDHLAELFDPASAGPLGQYARMRTALAECDQPRTALNWLRNSRSAALLAELVAAGRPLVHEDLDTLAQACGRGGARAVDYLRGVLLAYRALPERDELPARVDRHLARVIARHPEHALLLRAYVRWSLLPRARRRAGRAYAFANRLRWAQSRINTAADFLAATGAAGLALADVTQHEVDRWLAEGRSARYDVRDFLIWATRRGHGGDLVVPVRPRPDPLALDEDSHWEVLHQCLTDTDLPLDIRAAGALLFLFGQELTRLAALPVEVLTVRDEGVDLVLDRVPMRLPEALARLLTELADQPPPAGWAANHPNRWLFPAVGPGRHITGGALARRLAAHGIPNRPARATALVQLAQDFPPAVLAPMLGLHINTAERWRHRAGTDWTAYL
ncbi:hypothetical protein [Streptomyces sp. NBC_01455]|uniref:hypothetical protein n=2 Tax=unclassified Streptomyces TaxID=2593676 RepID=UPI002E353279|nr:hypothetical protein [Streptomyces sp. NBC_01455]